MCIVIAIEFEDLIASNNELTIFGSSQLSISIIASCQVLQDIVIERTTPLMLRRKRVSNDGIC